MAFPEGRDFAVSTGPVFNIISVSATLHEGKTMGERVLIGVLIAVAAGFLLTAAPNALTAASSDGQSVTVSENNQIQKVTGGAEKLTATHVHRILKHGAAPGDVRPQYITGAGYTPSQIGEVYGLNNLQADGTGQTVAIVVAYGSPTLADDVAVFCTAYRPAPAGDFFEYLYPWRTACRLRFRLGL